MWEKFSNLFSGSDENTPATGFGIQQSDTPTPNWFWGSNQPTQGFGVQQATAPVSGFGFEQSYNAMNSPSSSLTSGTTWGSNPYQRPPVDWWSMDGAFGNGQTGGWAMPAMQGLQAMFNWTQGNKALDLARDQFNFSKKITQKNLANQTSLLNTAMQDRQNARRSSSSSYQDTDSYMKEHGL